MKELIEVGCNVLIQSRNGSKIAKVSRETKTQWVVKVPNRLNTDSYEDKYRKDDLKSVGTGAWDGSNITFLSDGGKKNLEYKWDLVRRKKEVIFQISKMIPSLIRDEDLEVYESLIRGCHNEL